MPFWNWREGVSSAGSSSALYWTHVGNKNSYDARISRAKSKLRAKEGGSELVGTLLHPTRESCVGSPLRESGVGLGNLASEARDSVGRRLKLSCYLANNVQRRKKRRGTKNVSEPDLTPRMKYIMVRLENWRQNTCTRGVIVYRVVMNNKSSEWLD